MIYSQGFNFSSFIEKGVDPRTGQYTCTIDLYEAPSQARNCPPFKLSLSFNPLNTENIGFGSGWSLSLPAYEHRQSKPTVILSTGESYQVTESSQAVLVKDKKLESFQMTKLASDTYQVSYKSGQVEILKNRGNAYKRSVLHELYASTGRSLIFEWDRSGDQPLLTKINQGSDTLVEINYKVPSSPTITRSPNTPEASTFTIVQRNNQLDELRLPLGDAAPWKILYSTFGHIRNVTSPSGLVEEIQYKEDGHQLPTGAPYRTVPYVISHTQRPGNGQDAIVTNYAYSSRNFLGYNGSHSWNDGEDNLFRSPHDYTYDSTVTVQGGAQTKNTYNKFHLLSVCEQQKKTKKVTQTITYHANVSAAFDAQPAQYQLPKRVDTKYEDTASKASRTETSHHQFDKWGNPTEETESNGITTIREYYAPSGEKGSDNVVKCPADPHGFQRYIKTKTERPAPSDNAAPARVESYTYAQIAAATGGKTAYFVVVKRRQSLGTGAAVLTTTNYDYMSQPTTRDHGRLRQQVAWVSPEFPIAQDWLYAYPGSNQLSQTTTTKTFDGSTVAEQAVSSLWSGLTVSYKNEAGVTEHFYYDKIGRQVKAVTAQGTPYESAQQIEYAALAIPNGSQRTVTDAAGVRTRYTSDGLERLYTIEKQDDVTRTLRLVQQNKYNALGQQTEVVEVDWLRTENKDKPTEQRSTKSMEYDDWGNMAKVTESNGLVTLTTDDPISLTTTQAIRGEGSTRTERNLFGSPKAISLLRSDAGSTLYSKIGYAYDGFGRCVSTTDHLGRTTAFAYDAFDRISRTSWPSGRVVDTQYALHTTAVLPRSMTLNGQKVGEQSFDGLDRITSIAVGARTTRQTYQLVTPEPTHITSPKGDQLNLTYESALDHAPTTLTSADTADSFQYDGRLAALSQYSGAYSTHSLHHSPSGLLSSEVIDIKRVQQQLSASYTYSLRGRLQTYTDVHGTTTAVAYDEHGRPTRLTQAKLVVSLVYNTSNRVSETTVTDDATKTTMTTKLTHDDFGRETQRSIYKAGTTLLYHLTQSYNEIGLVSSRTKKTNQAVLRAESFQYDTHNRLVRYDCQGSQPPTDHKGRGLRGQQFTLDAHDNITKCSTTFDDGTTNTAVYSFSNPHDPTQLTGITNTHADEPAKVDLRYDANGCLTRDEQGRTLQYNSLNRLTAVLDTSGRPLCQYEYDASGRLARQAIPSQPDTHFFYRGDSLIAVKTARAAVSYLSSGAEYWAETATPETGSKTTSLWAVDSQQSVTTAIDTQTDHVQQYDYTPYCSSSSSPSVAFNGQWRDPVTGWYHLGNGYRVYNPVLMRFHTPDPWSPFTSGEVNAYAYCLGDPINRVDPSGHFSLFGLKLGWKDLIMTVVGIAVSIGVGILTGGASLAIQVGVGLAAGVLSDVVSGVVGDLADGNKPTWASVGLDALGGLLGGIGGAVGDAAVKQGLKQGVRAFKAGSMAVTTALGRTGSFAVSKPVAAAAANKTIAATVKSTLRGIARGFIAEQAAARGGVYLTGLASEDAESSGRSADRQGPPGSSAAAGRGSGGGGGGAPAQVGSQTFYLSRGSSVARDMIRPAMKNGGGEAVTHLLKPPQVSTSFLSGYGADPGAGQALVANLLNRDVRFAYELSRGVAAEQDDGSES